MHVWAGIVNGFLTDLFLLLTRLNDECYHIFLEQVLPELLQDVPITIHNRLWFQHDRVPAHFSTDVHTYLNAMFGCNGLVVVYQSLSHPDLPIYRLLFMGTSGESFLFDSTSLR
ncbi:uncharacterized protein TNCV_2170811 [Trichonephila clavipes]|nr:uncharacterized protein TNCV_2170811 [Trichonephila clavipes]